MNVRLAVAHLQLPIRVCLNYFSQLHCNFTYQSNQPIPFTYTTLTFELRLHRVKVNQNATYLDQKSLGSKTVVRAYTHTGPTALAGLLQ